MLYIQSRPLFSALFLALIQGIEKGSHGEIWLDAALRGDARQIQLMMDSGSDSWDPGLVDASGRTPLHLAVMSGSVSTVRSLLSSSQAPAAMLVQDRWGWTPLHYSALRGDAVSAELLLLSGSSDVVRDVLGRRASDYAELGANSVCYQLLTRRSLAICNEGQVARLSPDNYLMLRTEPVIQFQFFGNGTVGVPSHTFCALWPDGIALWATGDYLEKAQAERERARISSGRKGPPEDLGRFISSFLEVYCLREGDVADLQRDMLQMGALGLLDPRDGLGARVRGIAGEEVIFDVSFAAYRYYLEPGYGISHEGLSAANDCDRMRALFRWRLNRGALLGSAIYGTPRGSTVGW